MTSQLVVVTTGVTSLIGAQCLPRVDLVFAAIVSTSSDNSWEAGACRPRARPGEDACVCVADPGDDGCVARLYPVWTLLFSSLE